MKRILTRIRDRVRDKLRVFRANAAEWIQRRAVETQIALMRGRLLFSHNKGESYVDTALKILICVVLGALLLTTLYTIFKDNVLKTLNDKITELFSYSG